MCTTACAANLGMDGTFMVMGSNPCYWLPTIPFPKRINFHTPVGFIPPTSAEKLLLEVPAARDTAASPQLLPVGQRCPSPASHKSTFALHFSAFVALSSEQLMKKTPVLHQLLRHQRWVLCQEQPLIFSCGDTGLGRLSHQRHFCKGLLSCRG